MLYNPKLIAKRLIQLRHEQMLSIPRFAVKGKITVYTLRKLLNGENTNPTVKVLISLAHAFNKPIERFLK